MNNSIFVVILAFFLYQAHLAGQEDIISSRALSWSAETRGTGQVCNEIAIVKFKNTGNQNITFREGSYFIPSDGKHQAYLVPKHETFELAENTKTKISFNGYCLDYNLPPARKGKIMTSFKSWINLNTIPEFNTGESRFVIEYEYLNTDNVITNISEKLKNERKTILIPRSQLNEVLPLVLDAYERLERTINYMYHNSDFRTVFSIQPEREKTILMQHCLWLYISTLTGQKYDKTYFKEKLTGQLEDITHKKFNRLPSSMTDDFEKKVDELWNYFYTASYEAGIIAPRITE